MLKRNANVEFMRIIAMLFIIMHHCIINGFGLQERLKAPVYSGGVYDIFLGGLNAVVVIGVNVFFLISGYYGIKISIKKFLHIVLDLYIYADALILISILTGMEKLGFSTIKLLVLPFYKYWFVIVYLFLYLLSPIINAGIDAIKKEYAIMLAGVLTLFFGVLGFLSEATFFSLNNGYSLMFAVYLYYIGRMMNKYKLFHKPQSKQVLAWLVSTSITAVGCAICILIQKYDWAWRMFSYNQLFLTFASINFVWIFLNLPDKFAGEKWQRIASSTLAVYYIHTSTVFSYYRNLPLKWAATNVNYVLQILILVLYAIVIYLICCLIDQAKVRALGKTETIVVDKFVCKMKSTIRCNCKVKK